MHIFEINVDKWKCLAFDKSRILKTGLRYITAGSQKTFHSYLTCMPGTKVDKSGINNISFSKGTILSLYRMRQKRPGGY